MLLLLGSTSSLFGQAIDSTDKVNDVLLNIGSIGYDAEFYRVEESSFVEHHFVFQPYLLENGFFNIDVTLVNSFLPNGNFFVPGDLSLNYQQIFKTENYKSNGFQGWAARMKFTIPTGSNKYLSGFDSWTIEPLVGVQWLLGNTDWLIAIEARYNYSFAALPESDPRFSFVRLEPFVGFENENYFVFISSDYRYIPSKYSNNLFLYLNIGYKFSTRFGASLTAKPRVLGSDFFDYQLGFGSYFFF